MAKFIQRTSVVANDMFNDAKTYLATTYKQANYLFTSASPFAQILKVMTELTEQVLFYLEDATVEQNIETATNKKSIRGLARLTGHDPSRGMASNAEIRMRFKPDVSLDEIEGNYLIIQNRSKLKCSTNNLIYSIDDNFDFIKLDKGKTGYVNMKVVQGEYDSQTVTGTGQRLQSFNISVPKTTDHFNVMVKVNEEVWPKYDSLYDMRRNEKGCMVKTGIAGGLDIYFGTGNFGAIPPIGASIQVQYFTTDGARGNVAESADIDYVFEGDSYDVTGKIHDPNDYVMVESVLSPKMGADEEDVNFTKRIAPYASRNFTLSHPNDFEYFLSRYDSFSNIDAYNTFDDDNLEDDNVIYLNIWPDIAKKMFGTYDYFGFPQSEFILDDHEKSMIRTAINKSGQMMIGSELVFVEQELSKFAMDIRVRYWNNYDVESMYQNIRTVLSDYFTQNKRRTRIPRSDIIRLVELVDGIDSVNVTFYSDDGLNQNSSYIDSFGDIEVKDNILPIIRGGWSFLGEDGMTVNEVLDEPTLITNESASADKNKMYSLKIIFDEAIEFKSNMRVAELNSGL